MENKTYHTAGVVPITKTRCKIETTITRMHHPHSSGLVKTIKSDGVKLDRRSISMKPNTLCSFSEEKNAVIV